MNNTESKRCLVYETLGSVSNLKVTESKDDGLVRLEGVFGVCGVKNQNNRIYDKENYRQMVESLQKVISETGCPGELEHPNSMNINLANVSHKIESINMNEDGTVTGTVVLLNTPKGNLAKGIIEGGLPLFISSRGSGTITNEGRVTLSAIKTYDLVGTPGFSQAKLTLKENQTLECLNESQDENAVWVIVEGSEESKPKDDDDAKDADDNGEKGEKKEDAASDADEKDTKNNDKDIDMKDLKEAIDQLTKKVETLEAELHVAKESLNEVQSAKSPEVNYQAIQEWLNTEAIASLKEELGKSIEEKVATMTESIESKMQAMLTESTIPTMKEWVNDQYTSMVETWINNELMPSITESTKEWVVNDYGFMMSSRIQEWLNTEYSKEQAAKLNEWLGKEFAPAIQEWLCTEYTETLNDWINEELSTSFDQWISEHFAPEHTADIEKKVNESVAAFIAESNAGRLEEIDSLLETINQDKTPLDTVVKESLDTEKYRGVYCVEHMPAQYRPMWEMAEDKKRDEIIMSSSMYDFTRDGVLESFWANVDFAPKAEEKQVVESASPVANYYAGIANAMSRLRTSKI